MRKTDCSGGHERKFTMKKIITALSAFIILSTTCVHGADTWKDLFVTRLMKLITNNPTYSDVVLTDLDKNGIPEAFLLKKGMNGGIKTGITFKDGVIVNIDVPLNVTGACLEDITVYDAYGENVYVGKEIGRYTSEILYFELCLENNKLTCESVEKNDYSDYSALPYKDIYGKDFYDGDYPDRDKLEKFMNEYDMPTHINVKPATAKVSVNGNPVDLAGVMVSESNYYKIRDVAMVLSTGVNRFSVSWDSDKGAISITTGRKYSAVGGELSGNGDLSGAEVSFSEIRLIVNGAERKLDAYNINGNNYFKIRDLADLIGFTVGWDSKTGTVTIDNN